MKSQLSRHSFLSSARPLAVHSGGLGIFSAFFSAHLSL